MAAYPKYQPQFGIYNPNNFSRQPTANDGLTIDTAKLYFLQFPNAQTSQTEYLHSIGVGSDATFNGVVTFNETVTYNSDIEFTANVSVDGTATVMDNLLCDTTATVSGILTCESGIDISVTGGITFPDNTTQTTAFIEANYAQLNTDNTFLATFTNDFNGNVNLNGITNGVTQLTGDNSTLLATTEFVQNTVQVAGVQVGDSPLLWTGANTNQYNAGTGTTLPYSYPYGLSQLYNLSGGNEEFSLVANNGLAGASPVAFRIYCIQGNQTGTQISALTPQFQLSNDGSTAFIRDGINVNANNIIGIGALAGNAGNISCNSNLLIGAGNVLNLQTNNINNVGTLNGSSGGTLTLGTQSSTSCTITGGSFTAGLSLNVSSANGGFNMNYYTANNLSLNMRVSETFKIQNTGTSIMEFSPTAINAYQNLGMNGKDISMLGGDILGCTSITNVTGTSWVTTDTPLSSDSSTKIATTAFVKQLAPSYIQSSFTVDSSYTVYFSLSPSPVSVIATYTSANNTVSFNNIPFVLTVQQAPTFFLCYIDFSVTPFPNYPPPSTLYMSMYCSNGTTYTATCNFMAANTCVLGLQSGPTLTSGMTFTGNLANIGAFNP